MSDMAWSDENGMHVLCEYEISNWIATLRLAVWASFRLAMSSCCLVCAFSFSSGLFRYIPSIQTVKDSPVRRSSSFPGTTKKGSRGNPRPARVMWGCEETTHTKERGLRSISIVTASRWSLRLSPADKELFINKPHGCPGGCGAGAILSR